MSEYIDVEKIRNDLNELTDDQRTEKMNATVGRLIMIQAKGVNNTSDAIEMAELLVVSAVMAEDE